MAIKRTKYFAINLILFAFLYMAVSFNKEFIRPNIGDSNFLNIMFGCFPNFLAAYVISLFPVAPLLGKKATLKKSRIIVYAIAFFVFIVLSVEEFNPFFGASSVFDIYDIIGSGIGSLLAVITFELLINKTQFFNKL